MHAGGQGHDEPEATPLLQHKKINSSPASSPPRSPSSSKVGRKKTASKAKHVKTERKLRRAKRQVRHTFAARARAVCAARVVARALVLLRAEPHSCRAGAL